MGAANRNFSEYLLAVGINVAMAVDAKLKFSASRMLVSRNTAVGSDMQWWKSSRDSSV